MGREKPPTPESRRTHLGRYQACDRCRTRHIRCQGDRPCRNCKKANTNCAGRKGSIFRFVQYPSGSSDGPKTQTRLKTGLSDSEHSSSHDSPVAQKSDTTPSPEDPVSAPSTDTESPHDIGSVGSLFTGLEHSEHFTHHDARGLAEGELELPLSQTPLQLQTSSPLSLSIVPTHLGASLWPLKTEYESSLFRYFLTNISPWFDYCDPQKHFRTYVASAAATDTTLLYAILAVSARHQSSNSGQCSFAEECQQRCLSALLSNFNDHEGAMEEAVFASALILRLIEEMTEPYPGGTIASHTLSAQLLVRIKGANIYTSRFTEAAFIVTLRQEIFLANLTQRPVGSITEHCNIDESLGATSDVMWALRTIALAAKATDFAYGDPESRTKQDWNTLMQYVHDWEELHPASFNPIYHPEQRSQSNPFPKMWFCNDYHVAARQYLELSRILLLASDPHDCQMRIGRTRMGLQNNDEKIRESVRVICGVALSNDEYVPASLTAGLVIAIAGELFYEQNETRVLLRLLSNAESHLAWHCLKSKDDLQRLWKLSDLDIVATSE